MTIEKRLDKVKTSFGISYPKAMGCDYKSIEYRTAIENLTCTQRELVHKPLGFVVQHR